MLLLTTLCALFIGCSDDGGSDTTLQPSNLNVEITVLDDTQGLVKVTATADNVNFYLIDFGVGDGFEKTIDGEVSYQYSEQGSYEIIVRANATDNLYVETKKQISITFDDEIPSQGYTTPLAYDGYTLFWNDEFDGSTISNDWNFEIGTGNNGWGNNELQYYRRENASLSEGNLIIEAKSQNFEGRNYTSSRMTTQNKITFRYGRVDIRAILPKGQGIWPALWMLGTDFPTVGWPYCGEIDIMEMIGGNGRENTVYGTLHWDNNGSYACTCDQGNDYKLAQGTYNDKYHVFSIIWDENKIEWYVDDNLFKTVSITPADLSEFRNDYFLLFNVAVGGNWPGNPDGTTQFPQRMIVDYVRVFQK